MVTAVVAVTVIVARMANHAVDRAHRAADTCTNRTAHDTTDRACGAVAAIGTFFRTADDALCMPGQRSGEQHQKRQGGGPCKGSICRLNGGGDCFHFRLSC